MHPHSILEWLKRDPQELHATAQQCNGVAITAYCAAAFFGCVLCQAAHLFFCAFLIAAIAFADSFLGLRVLFVTNANDVALPAPLPRMPSSAFTCSSLAISSSIATSSAFVSMRAMVAAVNCCETFRIAGDTASLTEVALPGAPALPPSMCGNDHHDFHLRRSRIALAPPARIPAQFRPGFT